MSPLDQIRAWDYFKPRHTHAWNMLCFSWEAFDKLSEDQISNFEQDYCWENYFIRLWLYRTTVNTLTKLPQISQQAKKQIHIFDSSFEKDGKNQLRAIRNMIEHFDDYATGAGRGPALRETELDPWRTYDQENYERGRYSFNRQNSMRSANNLRLGTKPLCSELINWFNDK